MRRTPAFFIAAIFCARPCAADLVKTEDIFRSLHQDLGQAPDYSRLIPWLIACAGVAVAVALFRQRQKRQANPKPLNHPGKLVKEMARLADVDPAEMKKMKSLAAELEVQSPLTLLLCPSLRPNDPPNS